MKEFLNRMIISLNTVEVRGKDNLDIMLGCIQECEKKLVEFQLSEMISEKPAEPEDSTEEASEDG